MTTMQVVLVVELVVLLIIAVVLAFITRDYVRLLRGDREREHRRHASHGDDERDTTRRRATSRFFSRRGPGD